MRGWTRGAAALVVGAVLLLGCGGDDDGEGDDASPTTAEDAGGEAAGDAGDSGDSGDETTTTEEPKTSAPTTSTTTTTEATTTAAPAETGSKPWQDLGAGECIDPLPAGTFTEVTVVDCAQPHAAESITPMRAVQISGGDADASAQSTCDQELATVGATGLAASYILEVQGTLVARAVCLVVDPSGAPLTGSVVAR